MTALQLAEAKANLAYERLLELGALYRAAQDAAEAADKEFERLADAEAERLRAEGVATWVTVL